MKPRAWGNLLYHIIKNFPYYFFPRFYELVREDSHIVGTQHIQRLCMLASDNKEISLFAFVLFMQCNEMKFHPCIVHSLLLLALFSNDDISPAKCWLTHSSIVCRFSKNIKIFTLWSVPSRTNKNIFYVAMCCFSPSLFVTSSSFHIWTVTLKRFLSLSPTFIQLSLCCSLPLSLSSEVLLWAPLTFSHGWCFNCSVLLLLWVYENIF